MAMIAAALGSAGSAKGLALTLAMAEGPDALSSSHAQLLMVFIALAAFALFVQAVVFSVMAVGAMKAQKRILSVVDKLETVAIPLIVKTRAVVEDLEPKLRTITENISDITTVVRAKAHEIEPTITAVNATVTDANLKTRAQVTKVDGMVSSALNATAEIASTIHQGIRGPVKEVAGLINGLKIGFETLIHRSRAAAAAPTPQTPPSAPKPTRPSTPGTAPVVVPSGPAPDAAPAAQAQIRNEISFAAYRAAMQAKRRDLDL